MKRAFSWIIALCMILSLLPAPVFATSGTCGDNVTWDLTDGVLTLSGEGPTYDYAAADPTPWYSSRSTVTTIVVEEGVTRIGDNLFTYHQQATSAVLPESVTEIGAGAFSMCSKLSQVELGSSTRSIGDDAFKSCMALTDLELPETLTALGVRALASSGLVSVRIPEGITELAGHLFEGCYDLAQVVLHDGIESLGEYCFAGCSSLEALELPEGIRHIPQACFTRSGLVSMELPDGVVTIGKYAFDSCQKLESIYFPDSATEMMEFCLSSTPKLKTVRLSSKLKTTPKHMFSGSGIERIELPDGLVTLGKNTFDRCESLTEVIIPDSVCYIQDACFANCTALTSIALPPEVTTISYGLFRDSGIESFVFPEQVSYVDWYAFEGCEQLKEVTFAETMPGGLGYAFKGCTALHTLELKSGMELIPYGMFWGSGIRELTIPDSVTQIKAQAFREAAELEKLIVPASVETVWGSDTFEGTEKLTVYCWWDSYIREYCEENSIPYVLMDEAPPTEPTEPEPTEPEPTEPTDPTDPEPTEPEPTEPEPTDPEPTAPEPTDPEPTEPEPTSGSCGENAWWDLTDGVLTITGEGAMTDFYSQTVPWYDYVREVTQITVSEGITRIGDHSFSMCLNAEAVTLPGSLLEIGRDAFENCLSLRTIEIPAKVRKIEQNAFYGCSKLEAIDLPDSVTELGSYCFFNCSALAQIELSANLTQIPDSCFHQTAVQELTIPDGVTALGQSAFRLCGDLERVVLPDSVTQIGNACFMDCGKLTTIDLPDQLTVLTDNVFYASGLREIVIPDSVTKINYHAFGNCQDLEKVEIPETLLEYGNFVFDNCKSLKTVDLPDALTVIPWGMFSGAGIETIEIPAGVTTIEHFAFSLCENLQTLELPHGLEVIDVGAFQYSGLVELTLPDTVTTISNSAFIYCYDLEKLVVPPSVHLFGTGEIFRANPELVVYCWENTDMHYYCQAYELDYILMDEDPDEPQFNIWVTTTGKGSVTVSTEASYADRYVEFTLTPDEGESIESVTVYYDSEVELDLGLTQLDEDTLIFRMPACNVLIDAAFTDSTTTEPEPTDPEPTEPEPTDPEPTDPEPTEPEPTEPEPTDPEPTDPEPTEPEPTDPEPTDPEPTEPDPTEPEPTEPEPTDPIPTDPVEPENPFTDVSEDDFYYEPVLWAVEQGITSGTGENTFSPNAPCQRAQVVTFLWRAMGCPEPVSTVNPFTDVKEMDFYYKAVLWAVEQGITNGMTSTTFGPYAVCNRAQVVTFLHRALGRPAAEDAVNAFTDVKPGDYFYEAVLWAASTGVTSGVDAVTFAPGRDCVRAQVVTFLYRAFVK